MNRDSETWRVTLQRSVGEGPADGTLVATRKESAPAPIALEQVLSPLAPLDAPEQRYRSVERLGVGGMGEVQRAFDVKIGREVAMKTLLGTGMVGEGRFLREARVQALLEHPAIVPVYDIHTREDGRPSFTMKRIRGETLQEILASHRKENGQSFGPSEQNRLLRAFVTVCHAVGYAHERGILHRDLKPANVMLGPHGEVYVLDWGIAKILSKGDASGAPLVDDETAPGEIVGTLGYMAPEQVIGDLDAHDDRTDVYALGALLYEILTLAPLHGGEPADVMASTMDQKKRPVIALPGLPPELQELAARATSYHSAERPASPRELAEAVERYLDGDRDAALRASLADARAAAASAAMERALSGPAAERSSARADAMRDAGHALALVPEHAIAADVLLRLLAQPPDEIPREVEDELTARDVELARRAMGDNTFRIASWFLGVPLVLWMGVAAPRAVVAITAFMVACTVASFVAWKKGLVGAPARFALFAATSLLFALFSGVFGPFVMVPALAAVNTLLFSAQAPRRERPLLIAIGVLPFLAPLGLELAGLLPPSFTFGGGVITLHPRLVSFPAAMTFFFLATVSSLSVITPTLLTGRLRDALRDAEERLVLQKWQLAQLSPRRRRT